MRVTRETVLSEEDVDSFYPVYARAWEPLLTRAAARHVLAEDEFRKEMTDPRIEKFLVLDDDDRPVALTTLTRDLSVVDWINPDFYRAKYGDAVARGALFYLGYTLVDHTRRRSQALVLMAGAINRRVAAENGVVGYDICGYNDLHGIGRFTAWLFGASSAIHRLDTQTYYAADYRTEPEAPLEAVDAAAGAAGLRRTDLAERPDLAGDVETLLVTRWPTFLLAGRRGHDVDVAALLLAAPQHQVLVLDGDDRLQGVGLSLPLPWDGTPGGLPDSWDEAVVRSARARADGARTEAVWVLTATVSEISADQGVATLVLDALLEAAARAGAAALVSPVRPLDKADYPLVPMGRYVDWTTPEGAVFDPWLRLHRRLGGRVVKVADASIVLTGSVEDWRRWTGELLPGPGSFLIGGGLAPLVLEGGAGTYVEPSVWVVHETGAAAG